MSMSKQSPKMLTNKKFSDYYQKIHKINRQKNNKITILAKMEHNITISRCLTKACAETSEVNLEQGAGVTLSRGEKTN